MPDENQLHIETIARHLRGLGLTEQQIELHLAPLKTRQAEPNPLRRKIGRPIIIEPHFIFRIAQTCFFGLLEGKATHRRLLWVSSRHPSGNGGRSALCQKRTFADRSSDYRYVSGKPACTRSRAQRSRIAGSRKEYPSRHACRAIAGLTLIIFSNSARASARRPRRT